MILRFPIEGLCFCARVCQFGETEIYLYTCLQMNMKGYVQALAQRGAPSCFCAFHRGVHYVPMIIHKGCVESL